jgi:hypothetical protein
VRRDRIKTNSISKVALSPGIVTSEYTLNANRGK